MNQFWEQWHLNQENPNKIIKMLTYLDLMTLKAVAVTRTIEKKESPKHKPLCFILSHFW